MPFEEMICPQCKKIMDGEIGMCSTNHSYCLSCIKKQPCQKCGRSYCRRNIYLEGIIKDAFDSGKMLRCCYNSNGCQELLQNEELARRQHEEACRFRRIQIEDVLSKYSEEMKCKICKEVMLETIRFCPNSHNVCEKCSILNETCPECRMNITSGMNSNLRNLIQKIYRYFMSKINEEHVGTDAAVVNEEIKCFQCSNIMRGNIFMCTRIGNSFCEKCADTKLYKKNDAIMRLIKKSTVECAFSSKGCKNLILKDADGRKVHEADCKFRITSCRICTWKDCIGAMVPHYMERHENAIIANNILESKDVDLELDSDRFVLIHFDDNIFYFNEQVRSADSKAKIFHCSVVLLGSAELAKKYMFELESLDVGQIYPKIVVSEVCKNYIDKEINEDIIEFPSDILCKYLNSSKKFSYKLKLQKIQEN